MSLEDLRRKRASLNLKQQTDEILEDMDDCIKGINHAADVAKNGVVILSHLEEEFETRTKLQGKDIGFLFFATALQCVRQYFITDFKERLGDQEAANKTFGKDKVDPHDLKARKEAGYEVRHHKLYNPTLEEIILHPVPFDTTKGSKQFDDLNPFPSTGKLGHRAGAIGHDPVLGWIFGTANIATSTLTGWNMQSFHVSSKTGIGGGDFLKSHADTSKVLSYTFDKLLNQGIKGKKIVGKSLEKEAVHLASDVNTKRSLPFPIISTYDPQLASSLADYGLDMANIITVGKQASYASAINMLIAMIHRMLFDINKDVSLELYQVRTRRILSYSNVIASSSNILAVAISSCIGAYTGDDELIKKGLRKLDIGGFLVTIYRLINDKKFIEEIKEEFVLNNFEKLVKDES